MAKFRLILFGFGSALFLSLYFAYHSFYGYYSVETQQRLKRELAQHETIYAQLLAQRISLENRANLLNPHHIDLDMVEERGRTMLNYAAEDELIMMLDWQQLVQDQMPASSSSSSSDLR